MPRAGEVQNLNLLDAAKLEVRAPIPIGSYRTASEYEFKGALRARVVAAFSLLIVALVNIPQPARALDPRFNGLTIYDVGSVARETCPLLFQHMVPITAQHAVAVVNALCRLGRDPSRATHEALNLACIAMKKNNPAIGNLPEGTFESKAVYVCKEFGIDNWDSY